MKAKLPGTPDGKSIAYTTKRLYGKADAVSTNSDIYLYNIETGKEINITEGNMGYDRYPVFLLMVQKSLIRAWKEMDMKQISTGYLFTILKMEPEPGYLKDGILMYQILRGMTMQLYTSPVLTWVRPRFSKLTFREMVYQR